MFNLFGAEDFRAFRKCFGGTVSASNGISNTKSKGTHNRQRSARGLEHTVTPMPAKDKQTIVFPFSLLRGTSASTAEWTKTGATRDVSSVRNNFRVK
ncbi:hypothetical protein CSUI_007783 [Cystoisospora suis]|uniref:Uncharacterized protein n=1 Tax=Cystoisospora suis TaxID=483139 RepID=A0A2C6KPU1_9APIC|nr:hypothetical protein CSUI_007783 [Cystoisospora suis]